MAPDRKQFKLLKYEHIIYSFEARNLEISNKEFLDFMNTLRNFVNSVFARIFTKFIYLAKQFILTIYYVKVCTSHNCERNIN